MTTRNLEALFAPASIAFVGASNQPGSVGRVVADNLVGAGFAGPILPINPHERAIGSHLAYPDIASLPLTPELAVIATPPGTIPGLIDQLGARGCKAAVVITAGLDSEQRRQMLEAARPRLLRIVGPNCLGLLSPITGVNASFAHLTPVSGGLALVAQSGAVATAALDWAAARGLGFSRIATLGDTADVDFGDMLDFLAMDQATKAIVLYVESVTVARKFMSAGRAAARAKPVVVIKAGRSAAGAKAAYSHTGALAGSDAVYDAAFRRAGMLRVADLRELFDAVSLLTAAPHITGERVAVITNGGGAGVLAADDLAEAALPLAKLSETTLAKLDACLPRTWSRANPVDLIGDAGPERYAASLEVVLADPDVDAVVVLNCPTAVGDNVGAARAVVNAARSAKAQKPVITAWLGEATAAAARRVLRDGGLAAHETPGEAVRALHHLVQHRRNQLMMLEAPPANVEAGDAARAREVVEAALAGGRDTLSEPEAKSLLSAYGIAVLPSLVARSAKEAALKARDIPGPYALKILSADIIHKTDVGGVTLNLGDAAAVETEAEAMAVRVQAAAPGARLQGFVVQSMIARPHARELICGIANDAVFGPVILFGEGGVAVEARADRAVALPPLNNVLARDLIDRTQVARLLRPYRDRPGADLDAVARTLESLSALAFDLPEIAELDINPLLADETGVLALDARVKLAPPAARPAIRPYPQELVRELTLPCGATLTVRPVRPDDALELSNLVGRSAPEDRRLRFHGAMRRLPESLAVRLAQIDYEREMALVAESGDGIVGVARLTADPDGRRAEFALMVRTDWQDRELGRSLLSLLLDYADSRGIETIWGSILLENKRMLGLVQALGFRHVESQEPGSVTVERERPAACGTSNSSSPS